MSRKKHNQYYRDLKQQIYDKLTSMLAIGESKSYDRAHGTIANKIYSISTYETYIKQCKYFATYVQRQHPEVKNLKQARKYVPEWLQMRCDEGLSAWTIQTEAKALGKLYGITQDDKDYFTPPQRHRSDIKRSRGTVARDSHFSEENNRELVEFCRGTGLRRRELEGLRGNAYVTRKALQKRLDTLSVKGALSDSEAKIRTMVKDALDFKAIDDFLFISNGKGGRWRVVPIIGDHSNEIKKKVKSAKPDGKVWEHIPDAADIHGYRADYATAVYKRYAREIKDIPVDGMYKGINQPKRSEVYCCRKDRAGLQLDRKAMRLCSKALGHNRISVVADSYLHLI